MKKEYVLQGLACAQCAYKIEKGIQKLEGVTYAAVNAVTGILTLEAADAVKTTIEPALKVIVNKYEPSVTVTERQRQLPLADGYESTVYQSEPQNKTQSAIGTMETKARQALIKLGVGILFFAAGLALQALQVGGYAAWVCFAVSYLVLGGPVLWQAAKNITRGQIFDENFLMSLATIGAIAIREYPEAAAVMLFYQVGEYFQERAAGKSKKSIAGLMDIRPDYANLCTPDEPECNAPACATESTAATATLTAPQTTAAAFAVMSHTKVSPETVKVGDLILVKPGEKIPLDGIVLSGESLLDTKSLTGESTPRAVEPGSALYAGCVNQSGLLTVRVTKPFGESTVAKILDLVENAGAKKAPAEHFITTFARYYTPVVSLLALLVAVLPPLFFGGDWADWLHRGLVFLVISCPCALVLSVPLSYFGGIGAASRRGVLVKGGNYLDALNHLDIVVFDKTGTLTKGAFAVTAVCPAPGFTEADLLKTAAHAEMFSQHPLAQPIIAAYGMAPDKNTVRHYREIAGQGVVAEIDGQTVLAGNEKLMTAEQVSYLDYRASFAQQSMSGTVVHIAVNRQYAGCLVLKDIIKPDSKNALHTLKAQGVRETVMLTGDNAAVAAEVAEALSLDKYYAALLPHEKVSRLEQLDTSKRSRGKLAFVGDGINDAPVLARADIGVAMGGLGSDAAIEAADVVLMTDALTQLTEAVSIAKKTRRIVWQNIIFALGVKGIIMLLGTLGFAGLWEAVFADVGVALLAVLNATRVLR